MEIYLDHPDNGAMVVYSKAEQSDMEKKGWFARPSIHTPEKLLKPLGLEVKDGALVKIAEKTEEVEEAKKPGRKAKVAA